MKNRPSRKAASKASQTERVVALSDVHAPYQEEHVFKLALDFIKDFKPNKVILLGDFLDGSHVSTHAKDIEQIDQLDEFTEGNILLDRLERSCNADKTKIIYIYGNHEERFFRPGNLPQGVRRLFDPARWLALRARGIRVLPYSSHRRDILQVGKLKFIHGFSAQKYAANRAAERFGSVVFGHTHRIQIVQVPHIQERAVGFNIGCMCKLDQSYAKTWDPHGWQHGFGYGWIYKSGNFSFQIARVNQDRVHIAGKEYKVG